MRRHVDQVRARHPESSSSLDKQTEPPEASSREDEPGTSMHQPNAEPQPPDEQGEQQSAVPERLDLPVNPPAELRRSAREPYSCKQVPGKLMQIDAGVGEVIGVTRDHDIFTLYESSWTHVAGKLKHVTVGPAGTWGVNSGNSIFKLVAAKWVHVPGLLKQIDAGGDQFVSGANHHDTPFCLPMDSTVGYTGENSGVNWISIAGKLKYYSCGPYSCWGVNSQDQIFWVTSSHCQGVGNWQHIPGSLSMIEVGGDGSVYGINSYGNVFRRDSVSRFKPEGTRWTYIPLYSSQVKHVSYDTGHLWIILRDDNIYDCTV
ncbi:fish-egg lectin-like [Sardina pilchardus]|uniref:fish-egg lectin-like n=1 Tax=Sardina pilchardus TaxID=27697 RepID=UPI002E10B99F